MGNGGYVPYPRSTSSWQRHFAWWPVTIRDKVVWMRYVYRRRSKIRLTLKGMHTTWIYGDIFDVLRSTSEHTAVNPPNKV